MDLTKAAETTREQIEAAMPNLPPAGRVHQRQDGDGEFAPTEQQYRILSAFGDGLTYGQIARRVDCHESVVSYHLRNVRETLGVETSKEAGDEAQRVELL